MFKVFSLLPIKGNFGVIRMVVKKLVGANTLSGNRRRVKLNDVTEISDFYPTKLKRLTVSLTRAVSKKTEYKLKNDTKSCDESNFFFDSAKQISNERKTYFKLTKRFTFC